MFNYGEGGLYFESSHVFQLGRYPCIRIENNLSGHSECKIHPGFRSVVLGEVKWCKEICGVEDGKYGIGIKYYEPY
jgi:hypothetical protein